MTAPAIVVDRVNHYFGTGRLRKQILFDVSTEIRAGEIVILTGPSGSGKTTLLTLIGALRSTQEGSLEVLGQELRGASPRLLQGVRKQIGYIFQSHNLLAALTAGQNVDMSLGLDRSRAERKGASEMLEAVGLGDHVGRYPEHLSGGQRQRVAIARALAAQPRMILADEPTASLDKQSGRDVVELMQRLAKEQGVTVLLVTHDARILDIADRIIGLEDGRLTTFTDAVTSNTRLMMGLLASTTRKGDLAERIADMPVAEFAPLLQQLTAESQQFLEVIEMAGNDAFQSMLEQALEALTLKLGSMLGAERASLFLVDEERGELWSKVAQHDEEKPVDVRMPVTAGIAGRVATTGKVLRVDDAYSHPLFNRSVDERTGFRTRNILCAPIRDRRNRVFAVAQLLNRVDAEHFDGDDEARFSDFSSALGVLLETWWQMSRGERTA